LARFADQVDVVTFEFENVPAETVEILARRVTCRPGEKALGICQDRLQEKAFLEGIGVPVAPWRAVRTEAELQAAVAELGLPAVLKTTRLGYDGRGQAVLRHPDDLAAAWARLAPRPLILEGFVPFTLELSAIAARGADGALAVFDAAENAHRHHILDISFAPARVAPAVARAAQEHVAAVARGLDLVGLVALEMFLLPDGRLIGNEIAPRPHNSGQWRPGRGCKGWQALRRISMARRKLGQGGKWAMRIGFCRLGHSSGWMMRPRLARWRRLRHKICE
jgi:5-(carboxyamino)imidazole ribonucleotide synthase